MRSRRADPFRPTPAIDRPRYAAPGRKLGPAGNAILGAAEASGAGAGDGRRAPGVIEAAALGQVVQTREFLSSAEADERYFSKLPRFEPYRGAGRDVETKPIGVGAIELQRDLLRRNDNASRPESAYPRC